MITYPTITYDDVNGYRGISHVQSYNEDQRIGPLVPFLTGFVAGAPFWNRPPYQPIPPYPYFYPFPYPYPYPFPVYRPRQPYYRPPRPGWR